jgi:O-acetylserine/cysteine efflux transporter
MWSKLLKRHGATKVAPFSPSVQVKGLASGMFLLGECITNWQWAGSCLLCWHWDAPCWAKE